MKKIIALISEDFEDLELSYPVLRLREAGCLVDVVGEEKKRQSPNICSKRGRKSPMV